MIGGERELINGGSGHQRKKEDEDGKRALLDDPDIDAVYLPPSTSLQVKWAVVVAQKRKHLLMEKPVALNVVEIDVIVIACEENGVQFMDGTMWVHNLRTAKMCEFLSDSERFG
ncbi:hypothetical protein Ddye_011460 [Dipteronia dyeriana]|uniref:Gfo/Idh/MocA-like oxidoreductase N-terminal domain-containing protein n=1 Tax=Dipteronia dyeriana TaxID=168575 RepID=A0AAD9X2J2_9ROSI|nr:hypothetical protein Ddye_011460 [Dipteronia dyeriana]